MVEEKIEALHTKTSTQSSLSTDEEKGGNAISDKRAQAEKALVRKITFTIMPLVSWIIIVQVRFSWLYICVSMTTHMISFIVCRQGSVER